MSNIYKKITKMNKIYEVINKYEDATHRIFILVKNNIILPLKEIDKITPTGRICELGSGLGMVSIYIGMNKKRKVVGYELSKNRVKTANRAAKSMKNVSFEVKDLKKVLDKMNPEGEITFYINPPKKLREYFEHVVIWSDRVLRTNEDYDVDGTVYSTIDLNVKTDII